MAHYALQKLHMLPHVFISLPQREQAFIYASTLVKIEEEKKEANKIRLKRRRR
ncbi:hypothetical protein [Petroclostridium xylanilyticum]|jgi:hypothetical protein|uniref:hypothetical protein n=1 Tax=Petroclostridium xylanilyticum TaxID=1792311 RepID=UPI0018E3B56B|nr:hypothetical protein [Petroclostridium xylanilyticum]